jgi:glutathione S-transferase
VLYELAGADVNRRFSPYCWRIRLALAHKGLPVRTIAWHFTDKEAIARSQQGKVPVLVDAGRWVNDSWAIAQYLEKTYPQAPSLFGGGAGEAFNLFFSRYADSLNATLFRFFTVDIFRVIDARDRDYYRKTREERVGTTLEEAASDREQRLPAFRASLAPLRSTLETQPFLGGAQPLYADYAVFGTFQWARAVSSYQILAADDPVTAWRTRMLDLYAGLARETVAFY